MPTRTCIWRPTQKARGACRSTSPRPRPGWEAPQVYKRKEWLIDGAYHGIVANAAGIGALILAGLILAGKVN